MLPIALQEWAAICARLGDGRLMLAVRKGGIHERHGGLFTLEHERFALMPTYLHQDASRLRDSDPLPADPAPGSHHICLWAEAVAIWKVTDRERLDHLELPWTRAELDARFAYRNEPFLFVLALRVHRLAAPVVIPDHASFGGCRSWVPLREPIDEARSTPAIPDPDFSAALTRTRICLET